MLSSVVKDLYKSLKILSAELIPWHNLKKPNENEGVKVGDLLLMVDTMLEEVENQKEVTFDTYIIALILKVYINYLLLFQLVNYPFDLLCIDQQHAKLSNFASYCFSLPKAV